jgi:hypothetical protein
MLRNRHTVALTICNRSLNIIDAITDKNMKSAADEELLKAAAQVGGNHLERNKTDLIY